MATGGRVGTKGRKGGKRKRRVIDLSVIPSNYTGDMILREPHVEAITGLSRTQRFRLARRRLFPLPVNISDNARGYLKSEIDAWIASRREARAS